MSISFKLSRRAFLFRHPLLLAFTIARSHRMLSDHSGDSEEYQDFQSSDLPDLRPFGTNPATPDEVTKADELLLRSPENRRPVDVMQYLESLPDRNNQGEPYNGGWSQRWNPMIVRFFSQTQTKPAGDTTAWCAACLNWTLNRCGLHGTRSASSGSFRFAAGATDAPRVGDVVVFRKTDPDEANVGHGHVGIFIEQTDDTILVLGGNQKNKYGHHAVCRMWIPKKSKYLVLHSFHSMQALQ